MSDFDEPTIAEALEQIARRLNELGNGNAATPMGAIEALGLAIKESAVLIAEAIHDGLIQIADAIEAQTETKP